MTRVTSGTWSQPVEPHDLPEHLSYSQVAMLHQDYRYACPRKWAYSRRLRLPERRTPSLALGSAFDEAANRYFVARIAGQDQLPASAAAIEHGFAHLTEELEADPELFGGRDLAEWESMLMAAWSAFLEVEGGAQVAAVQSHHEFVLGIDADHRMPVTGYSDRLDADGTLVDHKFSGSPRWSEAGEWHEEWVRERRDQLLIYWLARAAEEKRTGEPLSPPLNGRARLVVVYHKRNLVTPQVRSKKLELSLADAPALLTRLGEASRIVHDQRYPARPGPACSFCSFVARCRDDEQERGRPFFDLCGVPF